MVSKEDFVLFYERWESLISQLIERGFSSEVIAEEYESIIRSYGQSHRGYHNFFHIINSLSWFDLVRDRIQFPQIIELALWYHDVVYDPTSVSNEEDSAKFAKESLQKMGIDAEVQNKVFENILVTKHPSIPKNQDQEYMLDIDLSILGSDKENITLYEAGVRKEYSDYSDSEFASGRLKVVDSFLRQDNIYHTDYFRQRLEVRARENLNSLIQRYK